MQILATTKRLSPYVKDVILMGSDEDRAHEMPIYADGFPGIMYSETTQGMYLQPKGKLLSDFFLYGQTIKPISLQVQGPFNGIVFQLYPFAAKALLKVDPKVLNDDCYDLLQVEGVDTARTITDLQVASDTENQIAIVNSYIDALIRHSSGNPDYRIKMAVNTILKAKGNITIKELREQLYIGERTLERHFSSEVGVTPKQFARIIQFNFSLNKLKEQDYLSLSDLSYESGFADQSHFIRTFKRYVGKTPKEFLKEM